VNFDFKTGSRTLFSASVSNLVQMYGSDNKNCFYLLDLIISLCIKLGANPFNIGRVTADSKWRPPPSCIYFNCQFLSLGRLSVVDGDVKFHKCSRKYVAAPSWIIITKSHSVLKFHVNRLSTFRDKVICTFCKFGLKCLFPPQICIFGGFDP